MEGSARDFFIYMCWPNEASRGNGRLESGPSIEGERKKGEREREEREATGPSFGAALFGRALALSRRPWPSASLPLACLPASPRPWPGTRAGHVARACGRPKTRGGDGQHGGGGSIGLPRRRQDTLPPGPAAHLPVGARGRSGGGGAGLAGKKNQLNGTQRKSARSPKGGERRCTRTAPTQVTRATPDGDSRRVSLRSCRRAPLAPAGLLLDPHRPWPPRRLLPPPGLASAAPRGTEGPGGGLERGLVPAEESHGGSAAASPAERQIQARGAEAARPHARTPSPALPLGAQHLDTATTGQRSDRRVEEEEKREGERQ